MSKQTKLKQIIGEYLEKYRTKQENKGRLDLKEFALSIHSLYVEECAKANQSLSSNASLLQYLGFIDRETQNFMEFCYGIRTEFLGAAIEAFIGMYSLRPKSKTNGQVLEHSCNVSMNI